LPSSLGFDLISKVEHLSFFKAGMECEWAKIKLVKQGGSDSVRSEELSPQVDWSWVFTRYS
jgi:hypothetical protein